MRLDAYYKIEIGPLQPLARPGAQLCAAPHQLHPHDPFSRLLAAVILNDLWLRDDPQERLWLALREAGPSVEHRCQVSQPGGDLAVDFRALLPRWPHRRAVR